MKHEDLTQRIIEVFYTVFHDLGQGFVKSSRAFLSLGWIKALLIAGCVLLNWGVMAGQETRSTNKKVIAPTPPMGWNSWDSYGLRIDEQQFRDNAEVLATKLKPSGYSYAVIDEGWYMVNPEDRPKPELLKYALDENGRFIPLPERCQSSLQDGKNAGFKQLEDWVHAEALKFGIHIIRGIARESVARN